ncbi:MAG: hypothetical protein SWO11_00300 [Thermodesulfobacteriota bacterium]|nr:hypothetical protein [Thermodesulfobacteriota bacterium]
MKCSRCGTELDEEYPYKIRWERVCEECYIDNSLPKHPCDPIAQMVMENFMETFQRSPMEELSERQRNIYEFIKEKGRVTPEEIAQTFGLRPLDLTQDFIILRRFGLAKGSKIGDKVYYVLWE